MLTLTVGALKGGVGKTTSAVTIAACMAERGRRVLLVDADPSAAATRWLAGPEAEQGPSLVDVLSGARTLSAVSRDTSARGVRIVPGSPALVASERQLASEPGGEAALRDAVLGLRKSERPDVVIVDSPPSLSRLTLAALVAGGNVLGVTEARSMGLDGLAQLVDAVSKLRRVAPGLRLAAILVARTTRTRLAREVEAAVRERHGALVLTASVREQVAIAEAPSHGLAPTMYAPDSPAVNDYRLAARELLGRLE